MEIKNTEIEVGVSSSSSEFLNSKGLNLKSKSSYLIVSCQVVAEEGKETVSDYVLKTYTNVKKVNVNKIADEVSKKTLAKLHGKAGVGGTKTCLLKPAAFDSIVSIITGHFSMFDVDRKMSLLVDKLDKKVFSDLLTIFSQKVMMAKAILLLIRFLSKKVLSKLIFMTKKWLKSIIMFQLVMDMVLQ